LQAGQQQDHVTRPGYDRNDLAGTRSLSNLPSSGQTWNSRKEVDMQVPVQEIEAAQIAVVLTAVAVVAFWRSVVRWMLLLASTAIIAALGLGLLMIWQATHHMTA
jgi:hypothetical protein